MADKQDISALPETALETKQPPPVVLRVVARPIDPQLGEELRVTLLTEFHRMLQPPAATPPSRGPKEVWEDWPES